MTRSKGFTLTELLIVLAIIGVLTTVAIGATNASRSKARDLARAADIREIQIGLALYYDVNKVYPTALATLAASNQRYLPSIPTDPQTGAPYDYLAAVGNKDYCLGVRFEGDKPSGMPDGANCSLPGGVTANYRVKPLR